MTHVDPERTINVGRQTSAVTVIAARQHAIDDVA